jgi:hypothetical protein
MKDMQMQQPLRTYRSSILTLPYFLIMKMRKVANERHANATAFPNL